MFSSQNISTDIILAIYKDARTVFRLNDIALITGQTNFESLNKKLNYFVHKKKLQNPRKGIYTKSGYNPEELACCVYTPAYISLDYVLQKAGIIFQYNSAVTAVSYLSRIIIVDEKTYSFRKLKGEFLTDTTGIIRQNNFVNIASPERAFVDMLYLDKNYYFDNLNPLNKQLVIKLLPIYKSEALTRRLSNLFNSETFKKDKR